MHGKTLDCLLKRGGRNYMYITRMRQTDPYSNSTQTPEFYHSLAQIGPHV
jgi:hypothetical protein